MDGNEKEETTELKIEPQPETKKINKKRKEKQEKVEKIIKKWLELQKTIKEEITLEDVIIKQQSDDFNYLKNLFTDYYKTKIQSRKQYEIMKRLEKNMNMDKKEYKIDSNINQILPQFYDNILIPNPEQEELLILIYKLLEEEITPMNSASVDEFLSDSSFIGKFISSYMNKRELKIFLTVLLNPLILSIENSGIDCMNMSLNNINKFVEKNKNPKKEIAEITLESLLEKIPKATIIFKDNYKLENELEEDDTNDREGANLDDNFLELSRESIVSRSSIRSSINPTDFADLKIDYNNLSDEYKEELNLDKIYDKIISEENQDLKDFYFYLLEQITNDPDIFTNAGLNLVLNDPFFKNNKSLIIEKYIYNFLFIKQKIDYLIQSLIDKISIIPYTIRCICKVISILMNKKFPLLPKYLRNSFLGKLIFDKCIFPVLNFENKNVMDSRIFSTSTKKCLNVIISVLSNANKCCLFPTTTDTEKTIFNYYLIEIIPFLNKFYEKVIDIQLPKALEELVSKAKLKIEQNIDNKIFHFKRKSGKVTPNPVNNEKEKKKDQMKSENENLYDYFKENSDEIIHLESICFSLSDVLFILSLIEKKKKIFQGLPKFDFFNKTCEKIKEDDKNININIKNHSDMKIFYIIFRDDKNYKLEQLLRSNENSLSNIITENKESNLICKKIKFCIKTVLKGLNLLNNKDFSHLNKAVSTNKFFSAIKHTLNELSEYSEENDKIPLKWYGQYIYNYKNGLDKEYQEDDFEKLYQEIFDEEKNILDVQKIY